MQRRWRLALGVLAVAAVGVAALVFSPDGVLSWLAWLAADPVRFGAALLGVALVRPLLAWPTTLLAVAVGYEYGVSGVPFALALIVVTSVPPFLVARWLRGDGRVTAAGERFVDRTGDVRSVTASRLLPAPSDVVSAGAGVAGVSTGAFVVGTAVGELPWAVAGVLAGSSLDALAVGATAGVFDLRLVAAAGLVAALLLAEPAYRHVRS